MLCFAVAWYQSLRAVSFLIQLPHCQWSVNDSYQSTMDYDTINTKWGLCCQKQVSQTEISNYIPQFTVGCNYLSLPELPASGNKVHKWSATTPCKYSYIVSNHSHSDVNVKYQRCRQATMMCTKSNTVCCNYDMLGLAIFPIYLICIRFNFKQVSYNGTNIYAILMQWKAISPRHHWAYHWISLASYIWVQHGQDWDITHVDVCKRTGPGFQWPGGFA